MNRNNFLQWHTGHWQKNYHGTSFDFLILLTTVIGFHESCSAAISFFSVLADCFCFYHGKEMNAFLIDNCSDSLRNLKKKRMRKRDTILLHTFFCSLAMRSEYVKNERRVLDLPSNENTLCRCFPLFSLLLLLEVSVPYKHFFLCSAVCDESWVASCVCSKAAALFSSSAL